MTWGAGRETDSGALHTSSKPPRGIRQLSQCANATFDPYGIWWRFQCKMWDDSLWKAREKFWCSRCKARTGKRVRPIRLDLVKPGPEDIRLPMPDEREWKRALSRFRA